MAMLTLPVVFTVIDGVDVLIGVIPVPTLATLPEVDVSSIDVVPVKVPAVCVIDPVPPANNSTTVPVALAPRAIPDADPFAVNVKGPVAVIEPLVVREASLVTEKLLPVEEPGPMFNEEPPLPTQVTVPVVLAVKLAVLPVNVPMLPEPETKFKNVDVIEELFNCTMFPLPLAVKLTVQAATLPSMVMAPLLAVDFKAMVPGEVALALSAVVAVIASVLVTLKLAKVAPPDARLNGPACPTPIPVLDTVAEPVVFNIRLGVLVAIAARSPMLPEVDSIWTEVVPDRLPAVCSTVPEPLAVNVTTVPEALAPRLIPPLPAVVDSINVPVAVTVPDVVKPALLETATSSPVDDPAPILSVEPPVPVQVTSFVVLKVKLVVVPLKVVMAPLVDFKFRFVAEIVPLV